MFLHFDRWIITSLDLSSHILRVHLLQLLSPSGLTSDEPVRNYMRSVQQAWEMLEMIESFFFFHELFLFLLNLFETLNLFLLISSCDVHHVQRWTPRIYIWQDAYRLLSSKLRFVTEDFGNHHHYSSMMVFVIILPFWQLLDCQNCIVWQFQASHGLLYHRNFQVFFFKYKTFIQKTHL